MCCLRRLLCIKYLFVEGSQRASDDDRDRAVVELREHLLAGRLTLDEFTERVESALTAKTSGDLVILGSDLPVVELASTQRRRRTVRLSAVLFGHLVRRGRLRLKRQTMAVAAFADIDLDLREAEIENLRTALTAFILFGNIDVYVPEGVDVDVSGLTMFGHRREWGRDIARPGAPCVRVRALSLFGTVDVWRVPHGAQGRYGDIIREVQSGQGELSS